MARHLQKSATTGHLLKTLTGHLAKICVEPGDDCEHCPDFTPKRYTVTLSGGSDCGCVIEVNGGGGIGASADADHSLDATFVLTQDAVDPCLWENPDVGDITNLYEWWGVEDCSGGSTGGPWSGTFRARLVRTAGHFQFLIYALTSQGSDAYAVWSDVDVVNCNVEFAANDTVADCWFNALSATRWKLIYSFKVTITPGP